MFKLRQLRNFLAAFSSICLSYAVFGQIDAGFANVKSSSATTVTVKILTAATLNRVSVRTQGAENLDFTDAGGGSCVAGTPYAAGATCTVSVKFAPKIAGRRQGAIVLIDKDGSPIATAPLANAGVAPQIAFLPGAQNVVQIDGVTSPNGLAFDAAGNLYIGNGDNGVVVKETPSGDTYAQSTVISGLTKITGIAVDGAGAVYAASQGSDKIAKATPTDSDYSLSYIGSGMSSPNGITVDPNGNLYIADSKNKRILKETLADGAYTQSVIVSGLSYSGVAVDSTGHLFLTAYDSPQVIKETPSGSKYVQALLGSGLSGASMIAIDATDNLYIADTANNRAVEEALTPKGYVQFAINTSPLDAPVGIAPDNSGNIFLSEAGSDPFVKIDFVHPPTFHFPAIGYGQNSPIMYLTIRNIGNSPLLFPATGHSVNPSVSQGFFYGIPIVGGCSQAGSAHSFFATLDAGELCSYAVSRFTTNEDILTGSLVFTDNNLNTSYTTQTVALTAEPTFATLPTTLRLAVSTLSTTASNTVTLTAHLTLHTGAPITAGTITFNRAQTGAPDYVSQTVPVDASGNAVWTTVPDPGMYNITASYSGDLASLASTSNPVHFKVIGPPALIHLQYDPNLFLPYNTVVPGIGVSVSDAGFNPLAGVSVTFGGDNVRYSPSVVVTNSEGLAKTSIIALTVGRITMTATTGSLQTNGSIQSSKQDVTVAMQSPPARFYGSPNPALTYTLSTDKGATTPPILTQTTATPLSPVGRYPITATLNVAHPEYYNFSVLGATLTVKPAPLRYTANSYLSPYGSTPPAPTEYSLTGFVNHETASVVSGTLALSTSVTSHTPVGNYPIFAALGTLAAANYSFSPWVHPGVVQVTKSPLSLTADSIVIHRGDPIPQFTYLLSGFLNGDVQTSAVSGTPLLSTTAGSSTKPGTYPIYIARGSLQSSNYTFTTKSGTLTILP